MDLSINKRVSFRALRILTYTILFKAIIDSITLIGELIESDLIYTIGRFADFINIVACVLCFVGIVALSTKFIYSHRIMVAVLILECVTVMLATFELRLFLSGYEVADDVVEWITLISMAAGRLLVGAAFFFLMTGFGEILRAEGNIVLAAAFEKLGLLYPCCNSIHAVLRTVSIAADNTVISTAAAAFEILGIVLVIIMYRRVSDAAFMIWKNRESIITKGWI